MKNTVLNFVIAALWLITTIINISNKVSWIVIGLNVTICVYFLVIGICQVIFSKREDGGKAILRKIYIIALILLFLSVAILTILGM